MGEFCRSKIGKYLNLEMVLPKIWLNVLGIHVYHHLFSTKMHIVHTLYGKQLNLRIKISVIFFYENTIFFSKEKLDFSKHMHSCQICIKAKYHLFLTNWSFYPFISIKTLFIWYPSNHFIYKLILSRWKRIKK